MAEKQNTLDTVKLSVAESEAFKKIRDAQIKAQQDMVELTRSIFESRELNFDLATNPVLSDDFKTIYWSSNTEAE